MATYNKNYKKFLSAVLIILTIIIFLYVLRGQKSLAAIPTAHPALAVQTTTVSTQTIPLIWKFPGILEAIQSVSIAPQINGMIKKIHFQPGDMICKGQLLFEIDNAPLQVALKQAKNNLQRDRAQLAQTQQEIQQYKFQMMQEYINAQKTPRKKTATPKNINTQPYERAKSLVNIQKAAIEIDKTQIRQAEIQLAYTKIHSPISGKAGNITKKVGDLAITANPVPLVIINQFDPLWVNFHLPQNKLASLLQYQQKQNLKVKIFSEDNNQLLDTGELKFIDNTVDLQTSNILLKAQLANSKNLLWPGLKVGVELILTTEPNAVVIPLKAVQLDQQGQFVYIIEKGKANIRRIIVDREIENFAIIKQGLKRGETIATVIPPELSDGALVEIVK